MTLMARYSGTCPDCGGRWQPGDLIRSDRNHHDGLPLWQHATCPDDTSLTAPHPACTRCWLTHPEGQCDR